MGWAIGKFMVFFVAFTILSLGMCDPGRPDDGAASVDKGDVIITGMIPIGNVPRVHEPGAMASHRISSAGDGGPVIQEPPVSILVSDARLESGMEGPKPLGDPGSSWTYDILISDQAWNMYSDGFQSMEVDPTNGEDAYVVYECWTDFATGTDQWCLAVRRTLNGGETWSPEIWVFAYPVQINGVYPDMKEPDIAISNTGIIWLTYTVFAYDGPSRNIINMQVFSENMPSTSWSTGPWTNEIVTDLYGGAYNYHRLPTIAIDQITNTPVITAMSYDAVPSSSQSSLVAWQPGATEWDGYEVLPGGPVTANYVQYPCMDAGSDYMYVTVMFYFAAGGVFDMVVYRSTDGGQVWELVGDFYDEDNINSFYKPSIAATKFGTDYVICAGTYTPDPSDQHFGDIGFAFSVDSGTNWDAYIMPMSNYQRMPYVQEFDVDMFAMSYRQEDGGPTYSTTVIFADTADLTYWEGFEIASDTGAFQASNWFAHVGLMERPDGEAYFSACWSDLRDAAAPITETSDTYVVYSTHGARYTFDTDPTGLDVIVDSVTYATPVMFNWPAGYFHDIEAPTPQTGGGGENYEWDHWSDAGARVHTILADTADVTFTAYYIEISQFVIPLQEDWNLISLPLIQDDGSINTVLNDIAGLWEYVMVYNTTDADHWKTFSTDKPPQLNDLNELDHKSGFWIYINDVGVDLTVTGVQPTSTSIMLYAGWNLVGYPSGTPRAAHTTLPVGVDMVAVYDGGEPYLIRDETNLPTITLQAGEGYWIHTNFDTTWVVDW